MNRKNKHRSGNRISGSLDPFEVEWLQSPLSDIFNTGNIVIKDLPDMFRERVKIAVSLRMRQAADMNLSTLAISSQSQDIISRQLTAHHLETDIGFVLCTLKYFSGEKQHTFSLNLNCASCNSRDEGKAFAHARADCRRLNSKYVNRILARLKERPWTNLTQAEIDTLIEQYLAIGHSIKFVGEYLTKLCNGKLPSQLGSSVYAKACALDPAIADHYLYNERTDIYLLNKKRSHAFTTVKQECATYIFCVAYRYTSA